MLVRKAYEKLQGSHGYIELEGWRVAAGNERRVKRFLQMADADKNTHITFSEFAAAALKLGDGMEEEQFKEFMVDLAGPSMHF